MASLLLIAVMVGTYAGIFLTSIWLCTAAERDAFPVPRSIAPSLERQLMERPTIAPGGAVRGLGGDPHHHGNTAP